MKKIVVLGSTGSIGQNALKVIEHLGPDYHIIGLATNVNIEVLLKQIKRFKVKYVTVFDYQAHKDIKKILPGNIKLLPCGVEGLSEISALAEADMVLNAVTGSVGFSPLLSAIRCGKAIALANKEPMVMAGDIIIKEAFKWKAQIIPVDSEPSAIFQCLQNVTGNEYNKFVSKIFLTASGGPFHNVKTKFKNITPLQALKHPKWKMGPKITVDSATLMNKGLEVIEIKNFFSIPVSKIEVLIHPQSIIHSAVQLNDNSVLAQMSLPDMRLPIQYAITFPERKSSMLKPINFLKLKRLDFLKPDFKRFPCLRLAMDSAKKGGCYPAILNAANEISVDYFLKGRIQFNKIAYVVEKTLNSYNQRSLSHPTISDIVELDQWARLKAVEIVTTVTR